MKFKMDFLNTALTYIVLHFDGQKVQPNHFLEYLSCF